MQELWVRLDGAALPSAAIETVATRIKKHGWDSR
jgi:hypothetical protein